MLSEIEIQKRGRHYRVLGIVNDRISNWRWKIDIFKKQIMEKDPYII